MIDKVAGIIIQDGKILGVKSYKHDLLFIPGGKREPGETDIQTLTREIKEELDVDISDPVFYDEVHAKNYNFTEDMKIRAYFIKVIGNPKPTSEIESIAWIDRDDYNKYKIGNALKIIIKQLIEKGFL